MATCHDVDLGLMIMFVVLGLCLLLPPWKSIPKGILMIAHFVFLRQAILHIIARYADPTLVSDNVLWGLPEAVAIIAMGLIHFVKWLLECSVAGFTAFMVLQAAHLSVSLPAAVIIFLAVFYLIRRGPKLVCNLCGNCHTKGKIKIQKAIFSIELSIPVAIAFVGIMYRAFPPSADYPCNGEIGGLVLCSLKCTAITTDPSTATNLAWICASLGLVCLRLLISTVYECHDRTTGWKQMKLGKQRSTGGQSAAAAAISAASPDNDDEGLDDGEGDGHLSDTECDDENCEEYARFKSPPPTDKPVTLPAPAQRAPSPTTSV